MNIGSRDSVNRTIQIRGRFVDRLSPRLLKLLWASLTTPQKIRVLEKIGIRDISASLVDWDNIANVITPIREKFINAAQEIFDEDNL